MARYIERVPKAKSYSLTHDFNFWRMNEIKSIRYIAGFGRICWITGTDYLALTEARQFDKIKEGARVHMNEDHHHNLQEICKAFYQVEPTKISMTSLDLNGFLMQDTDLNQFYYCSFSKVIEKATEFKSEIIKVLGKAREINSNPS